jgi:hypothetical protein
MAYKINIRNQANTAWINLLEAQYHEVLDAGSRFTGTTVETVLAELFDNKAQRVASTSSPTALDDTYQTGTVWVNTATDTIFVCVDNAADAAIWLNISSIDNEGIQDVVGAMVSGNTETNITVTYNDTTNKLDFAIAEATTTTLGVASFDAANFEVTAGAVKVKAGGITVTELATNIDASSIGFNSDKVDGRDVNDAGVSTNDIWTAAKIKSYVEGLAAGLDWQESVLDKDLNDPPATPATGDRYLVSWPAAAATGVWAGHDNEIATYNGTAWTFVAVSEGMATWIEDEDVVYVWNGTVWAKIGTTISHDNLLNLQGGNGGTELYHLTNAQHTAITGSKAANTFFASPDGTAGVGGFRAMVADDVPSLLASKISDFAQASRDAIGAAVNAGSQTNITVTYNGPSDSFDFSVAAAGYATLGVASFDSQFFTVTDGAVTMLQSGLDHGSLSGLGDDDHPHYVHNTIARTITAQHTFAPATAIPPFVLGANALGQKVVGFNADLLNGQDWTVAATASAPSSPAVNDIWVEITA